MAKIRHTNAAAKIEVFLLPRGVKEMRTFTTVHENVHGPADARVLLLAVVLVSLARDVCLAYRQLIYMMMGGRSSQPDMPPP